MGAPLLGPQADGHCRSLGWEVVTAPKGLVPEVKPKAWNDSPFCSQLTGQTSHLAPPTGTGAACWSCLVFGGGDTGEVAPMTTYKLSHTARHAMVLHADPLFPGPVQAPHPRGQEPLQRGHPTTGTTSTTNCPAHPAYTLSASRAAARGGFHDNQNYRVLLLNL